MAVAKNTLVRPNAGQSPAHLSMKNSITRALTRLSLLALTLAVLNINIASANTAITSVSGGGLWYWPGATIGYKFSTSTDIKVTDLGLWDEGQDGLTASHQVGLFSTTGSLLTSTTVTSASVLENGFRYTTIGDYSLSAGTYVIGAYYAGWDDTGRSAASITTGTEISYVQNLFLYNNGFTLPTEEWVGFDAGNIGPNFKYEVASQGVPDATPTSIVLAIGLIGLAAMRRKKA